MDALRSLSGDGLDGSAEALDLPPQRRHTGHVVVQINDGHLGAWMHLEEKS